MTAPSPAPDPASPPPLPTARVRIANFFDNPVYRLERGTRPLWRYAVRATFPAWLLIMLVPIVVALIAGFAKVAGHSVALNIVALVGWALMFVYPVWAGGSVLIDWESSGQLEAIRMTPLSPGEVARGLALAAGVRCAFVMIALMAGFVVAAAILEAINFGQGDNLNFPRLASLAMIAVIQVAIYIPIVMIPNILAGQWALLRWRRSVTPRLALAAVSLTVELPMLFFCSVGHLPAKVLLGWFAWQQSTALLRKLKDR